VLGPLAEVRRQGGRLDARGRLAVEVVVRAAPGGGRARGVGARGGGRDRVTTTASGSSGGRVGSRRRAEAARRRGRLQERVDAARGQLVRDAGEGARGRLAAGAGGRGHVGGQLRGEH